MAIADSDLQEMFRKHSPVSSEEKKRIKEELEEARRKEEKFEENPGVVYAKLG